jgi:hypothetical protein
MLGVCGKVVRVALMGYDFFFHLNKFVFVIRITVMAKQIKGSKKGGDLDNTEQISRWRQRLKNEERINLKEHATDLEALDALIEQKITEYRLGYPEEARPVRYTVDLKAECDRTDYCQKCKHQSVYCPHQRKTEPRKFNPLGNTFQSS